jgi:beta-phosphoglucomutase-like phosphatase (HAD superfamily)
MYRHTLKLLNAREPRPPLVAAGERLVFEGSLGSIQSAQAAVMTVLAIATTYPTEKLGEADHILPSLEDIAQEAILRVISANRPAKPYRLNFSR